jgi:hypothetical protein
VTRDGFTSGASFLVDASYSGNDLAFYGVEELKVTDRLRIDGGLRHQSHAVDGTIADTRPAGGGLDGDARTLYDNNDVVTGTPPPCAIAAAPGVGRWAPIMRRPKLGAFMRFSTATASPSSTICATASLTPQVDTIEGGVKLSTKPFSLYATLFHNRFQGLVTTVITEGARWPRSAAPERRGWRWKASGIPCPPSPSPFREAGSTRITAISSPMTA